MDVEKAPRCKTDIQYSLLLEKRKKKKEKKIDRGAGVEWLHYDSKHLQKRVNIVYFPMSFGVSE